MNSVEGYGILISTMSVKSGAAAQNVYSRDDVYSGNWWDSDNPWHYTDGSNQQRPDNNGATRNDVFIGHNNDTTMVVNGAFFQLQSLTLQSSATSGRVFNSDGSSGTGISLSNGLYIESGSGSHTFNNQFGIDGTTVTFSDNGGTATFTNNIFLNSNTAAFSGSSNITVSGLLQGTGGSVAKSGVGTVALTRASGNTYTGGTTVSGGTLSVMNTSGSATGTGAVTVTNAGTLSGTGLINAGANSITVNGVLSPGAAAAAGNPGSITIQSTAGIGALTLGSASTLRFDLGTSKDLVALNASGLTLGGGTLALTLGSGFSYATTYALFTGVSSKTGNFGTVTGYDTSMYSATFTYTGTEYDISFTPVPEPSTWAAGILSVAAIGFSQRRRFASLLKLG